MKPVSRDQASESSESDEEEKECHVCRDFKPFYNLNRLCCEGHYCPQNSIMWVSIFILTFPVDAHSMKAQFCRSKDCDEVHKLSMKFKKLKLIDDDVTEVETSS